MRKFENIVQSETAPQTNSLWLKEGVLYMFNNGAWVSVGGGQYEVLTSDEYDAIEHKKDIFYYIIEEGITEEDGPLGGDLSMLA